VVNLVGLLVYGSSTPMLICVWCLVATGHYGRPAYQMRTLYFAAVVSIFLLLLLSSSFFLAYSQRSEIGCLPYFHTWCGLSANLEMHVWNVLHVARWKYRTRKLRKQSPSVHHRTIMSGYIFATEACIDNRKKIVKQQYLPRCSHDVVNFGPLTLTASWDRFWSLGHLSKMFQLSLWIFKRNFVCAFQLTSYTRMPLSIVIFDKIMQFQT